MNLNVAIDSEVINIDGAVTKFLGKDAFKYKVKKLKITFSSFFLSFFLVLSSLLLSSFFLFTDYKIVEKCIFFLQILDQNVNSSNDNVMVYSHPVVEGPSSSSTRLIDKDDPRSKLHFVKYLKRDGKTLKIWECGIC